MADSGLDAQTFTNQKVAHTLLSNGTGKHYENGTLRATRTGLSTAARTLPFRYGPDYSGGTGPVDARFDNVIVRKYVSTDSSIALTLRSEETQPGSQLSALAAQDSAATAPAQGTPFRLRVLLHLGTAQLGVRSQVFKLQFVGKGTGTCAAPSGGTPAAYTDVATDSGALRFYNNTTPADGEDLSYTDNDPTHGADTIVNQTYEEANTFTSLAAIPAAQDGRWDFALVDFSAPKATTYCFRAVKSDGTTVDTYTVTPELTTKSDRVPRNSGTLGSPAIY